MCVAIKPAQILERRWTLDDSEQGPEVEELVAGLGGMKYILPRAKPCLQMCQVFVLSS